MATLGEIQSRVQLKIGNKQNWDTQIIHRINQAILQVIKEMKPQEAWEVTTFSTSDGTSEYTFSGMSATDVYAVLMVRDNTDDVEILKGGIREYNRVLRTGDSSKGDPRRWTRRENSLILYSLIPDSTSRTIEMVYLRRPALLATSTDTFFLNDEWIDAVEELAAARLWGDLNEPDKSRAAMSIYRDMLINMDKPESLEDEAPLGQFVPISNIILG